MLGRKTVEYRVRPVHYRGPIYIYASLGRYTAEEEREFVQEVGYEIEDLPRGMVIGTVEITACEDDGGGSFAWQLENPRRLKTPLPPIERPQPIWFHPFGRPD